MASHKRRTSFGRKKRLSAEEKIAREVKRKSGSVKILVKDGVLVSNKYASVKDVMESIKPVVKTKILPSLSSSNSTHRVYLDVPYAQKDEAKNAGAKWDAVTRRWYADDLGVMSRTTRWMKKEVRDALNEPSTKTTVRKVAGC